MSRQSVFDAQTARYEAWFEKHRAAYVSELLAVRHCVPLQGVGIEIGVGTGRFAAPLGVQYGLDPSPAMLRHAVARGITVVQGVAENLPFADQSFDYALAVTAICFVESPNRMLTELRRVLKPGGQFVLAFIDRDSAPGQQYAMRKHESDFYRDATFYNADDVTHLLRHSGFVIRSWAQTLSQPGADSSTIEPTSAGHGQGLFVVVSATPQA